MSISPIDSLDPFRSSIAAAYVADIEDIENIESAGPIIIEVEVRLSARSRDNVVQTTTGFVATSLSMRAITELELRVGSEVIASVKATDVAPAILD